MEAIKVKYIGSEPTRVRLEKGGEKVDVKPGQTVEFDSKMAKEILFGHKGKWQTVVKGGMNKEVVDPKDVEGDVEVEKAKPTKKKKSE